MTSKPFDPQLFEENDKPAREAVRKIFPNIPIIDNPDRYGVDLLYMKDGRVECGFECEVKKVWEGNNFPWNTIQFPARKAKFAKLPYPVLFIMFNRDLSRCLYLMGTTLLRATTATVPNKYVSDGEKFYQVPIDYVNFTDI